MKAKTILASIFMLSVTAVNAQQIAKTAGIKPDATINECEELKKENNLLKLTPVLYSNNQKDTVDNVEFSFFRAIGDLQKQVITVEVLLKNLDSVHKAIMIDEQSFTDELTNAFKDSDAQLGVKYYGYSNILYSKTPIKLVMKIHKLMPDKIQFVKNVMLSFSDLDLNKSFSVTLTGDNIVWK